MSNRMSIALGKELDDAIETYKFNNRDRLSTKNKAINELLELGLGALQEKQEERNKAPTAETAAEAMYEILFYHLGHPPTPAQAQAFDDTIALLCKGIQSIA